MGLVQIGVGILIGGLVVIATGFANKTGNLLAKDTYHKLRARLLGRSVTEENENVLEKIERVREEKNKVEQRLEEAQSELSEYDVITRSLRSKNVSRDELIEHYWDPLNAIIICFTNQKDSDGNKMLFMKEELTMRYNLKQLTGDIYIIPPNEVPEELRSVRKARKGLKELLKDKVYSNYPDAKSTICFAARVDLRDVYSKTDHPPENRVRMFKTIDEVLSLDEIFSRNDFSKVLASERVSLSDIIEEGSLPFLASDYISRSELDELIEHESTILKNLNEPSLMDLAHNVGESELEKEIAPHVSNPEFVSSSIIRDAGIWSRELFGEYEAGDDQQIEQSLDSESSEEYMKRQS